MRLIASVIVHNELDRYLRESMTSLLSFCDEVRVLDDFSTDGSYEWMIEQPGIAVLSNGGPSFFEHEGRARNALLDWTLEAAPSHILAIDADEIVADGEKLRHLPFSRTKVWSLVMEEVWKAEEDGYRIRMDGGWRARPVCCLYAPDNRLGRIADRALACGREPEGIRRRMARAAASGTSILHLGWANESERPRRYARYVKHDGGEFHANAHLESIMWPDEQVSLEWREWSGGLEPYREELLEKINEERP